MAKLLRLSAGDQDIPCFLCQNLTNELFTRSIEHRLYSKVTVTLPADFRRAEQGHVPGPKKALELSKDDREVLSLRTRGLWPSEIAVLLRMPAGAVEYRLDRLKKAGFTFSPPTAPRPIPHRKVTPTSFWPSPGRGFQSRRLQRSLG